METALVINCVPLRSGAAARRAEDGSVQLRVFDEELQQGLELSLDAPGGRGLAVFTPPDRGAGGARTAKIEAESWDGVTAVFPEDFVVTVEEDTIRAAGTAYSGAWDDRRFVTELSAPVVAG